MSPLAAGNTSRKLPVLATDSFRAAVALPTVASAAPLLVLGQDGNRLGSTVDAGSPFSFPAVLLGSSILLLGPAWIGLLSSIGASSPVRPTAPVISGSSFFHDRLQEMLLQG